MKKYILLIIPFIISCSSPEPEPLNYELLEQRDGVHYRIDNNKIYSGPVFNIDGTSEGYIKKGKWNGKFEFYYSNGQLKEDSTYKNDELHGPYKSYQENGQLKEDSTYKNDELHGPYKEYHKNGQIWEDSTYKNGYIHGITKFYHDNGQLSSEGTYNKYDKDGVWKEYYKSGKIKNIITYKKGKRIKTKNYDENGQLER